MLDSIKKDNKLDTDAAFQAALKESGMTLPQLRKMLEKNILISQVRQREVLAHVDITEAEEKAYYDAHTGEFASVPSVTLREIKVTVPTDARGVNAAAVDDARKKAEDTRPDSKSGRRVVRLDRRKSQSARRNQPERQAEWPVPRRSSPKIWRSSSRP